MRECVQSRVNESCFHGDGRGLTWGGGPLQQVEVVVDEGLAVVNSVHVDVFVLHRVKLRRTKTKSLTRQSYFIKSRRLPGNKSHTRILKRPPRASSSCCCRTCPGSGGEPSGVSAFLFRPWGGWPTPHTPNDTGSGSSSTWWIQRAGRLADLSNQAFEIQIQIRSEVFAVQTSSGFTR